MRKWNIPLTYAPKIDGVCDGTIRQTIRVGRKFSRGDLVSFHGWSGRPYRSTWSFRTPYFELTEVYLIIIYPDCILAPGGGAFPPWPAFGEDELADLARRDGIEPPTGAELYRVLSALNPIPEGGVEAQIIRW